MNADLLLVSAKYATPPANAPADAAGIFLYEIRAKRRVTLTPPEQWANHGEFSRDGIQVFYTRRMSATSSVVYRVFWDGSAVRRISGWHRSGRRPVGASSEEKTHDCKVGVRAIHREIIRVVRVRGGSARFACTACAAA